MRYETCLYFGLPSASVLLKEPFLTEAKAADAPKKPVFELHSSRNFTSWLAQQEASIAFTTYQAGKLFMIGLKKDGSLSVYERSFTRSMGLSITDNGLYLSSLYQLWRFENLLKPGELYQEHDRLYRPQVSWMTGDLDTHDLGLTDDGELVFVNTLFSCIARASQKYSFEPVWTPPFISKLAAEDRCHLNGLAMRDGKPRYVSIVSRSDVAGGWRDRRDSGGMVMDIDSNDVLCEGMSMPHSPRWHAGKLWVLNSGAGEFGFINQDTGKFEAVCFCPGYARGLGFIGDYALLGLSKPRNRSFTGLALDDALKKKDADAKCGIAVVDLKSGDLAHTLTIEGIVEEIYDVAALPGCRRPSVIGVMNDDIKRILSIPPA